MFDPKLVQNDLFYIYGGSTYETLTETDLGVVTKD